MHTQRAGTRRDVYIQNDSSGFSIVPSSAVDRVIEDDRRDDLAIVRDHQAILMMLYGDDSFPARLVVGGSLTEDEDAEWLSRVTWRLNVPCGQLLLCGGFDPRTLVDWRDTGDDWEGTVQAFDVPPGEYLVDVYTYRPTINGRFLEDSWPLPLGAWFRKEHPGRAYPGWLFDELETIPELDPNHEDEWSDSSAVDRDVEEGRRHVIGYLVHLRQWDAQATLTELPEDGWFAPENGARVPLRFPLGLPTDARAEGD
jgi:hypothetical protein